MFRRRSDRREGRGVLGTVGRTALIAGTATAVSHGVSGAMSNRAQQQQQAPPVQQDPGPPPAAQQIESLQAREIAQQTGAPSGPDMIAQLQQLADLKSAGMLSDEEFEIAKSKVLGS